MFKPSRVIFEKESLDYPLGQGLYERFSHEKDLEVILTSTNRVKANIPGDSLHDQYREGKKTLVVGVKKSLTFQSCKPSAHFQLPLVSGCIGQCEYCYLNTQLGDKPFVRVHVNVDEILERAKKYVRERLPEETVFEGAATSDPIPVEPYTGALKKAVEFFGEQDNARYRFVTKYSDVNSLLGIDHKGHTEVRFSLNTDHIITRYEHRTASVHQRIEAGAKLAQAGYRLGFLIAPVMLYENWQEEYRTLLRDLRKELPKGLAYPVTFEVISHRYTSRAKNRIREIFPDTTLEMEDEKRTFKYGQFGYGKFVYPKESLEAIKTFFIQEITSLFDDSEVKYVI